MKIEAKTSLPLTKESSGTYVCVIPDAKSLLKLGAIAKALEVELHDDDFEELHSTVIYSKGRFPSNLEIIPDKRYAATITGIQFWDGHDNDGYLVVTLSSPDLQALHNLWVTRGLVHSFPDYSPHVTLKHKLQNTARLKHRIAAIAPKVMGVQLGFSQETIEGMKAKKAKLEANLTGPGMTKLEAKSRLLVSAYSDFEDAQALAAHLFAESPLKFKTSTIRTGESFPTLGTVTFANGDQMYLGYAGSDKKVVKYQLYIGVDRSNELYHTKSVWPQHNKLMAVRNKELKKVKGFKLVPEPTHLQYLTSFGLVTKRIPLAGPAESPSPTHQGGKYAVKITAPDGRSTKVTWSTNIGRGPWPLAVAEGALQDVREQYAYDDDWKRASFSLVKVSN